MELRACFGLHQTPFTRELRTTHRFAHDQYDEVLTDLRQTVDDRMSAAVIAPSRLTPTRTVMEAPEVGPVALKTSSRDMLMRTGWPESFDSVSATGSR